MQLGRETVEQVALLARLMPSPAQLDRLTSELAQIVQFVELLDELDTEGIEPLTGALEAHSVFAEDELAPSLPPAQALANAPKQDGQFYHVPAVL